MKILFAILLLAVCVLGGLVAAGGAPVKLAIISESPDAATAVDALTTEFTRNDKVQLLEREQIAKIYQEQRLSAANTDYLKLGQLLGADGLLLVEKVTDGTEGFLNVRLVAVRPGVMLTAEEYSWPMTNLMEWSGTFAGHLNLFLPKLTVLVKDAIPISVINLRSAVASEEALETERQLKLLTIQRLSREKQLFVLERQKMQLLNDENQLRELEDSAFWSGSYLLEGVIDRDGYALDKMTINVRLTPPKGGTPVQFEVNGSRTNLSGVIDDLAKQVIAALQLVPGATAWNAADESEEFFAEAKWAHRWGMFGEAQAASESAWALGKRSRELAVLRVRAYADSVASINEHSGNIEIPAFPDPQKLPAMIRAVDLFCQDAPFMFTNPAAADQECFLEGIHVFREAVSLLDGFYQTAELRAGNEDQLAELRLLTRQALSVLETNAQLLPARVAPGTIPRSRSFSDVAYQQLQMYDLTKWEEGGVFFDRPEDALPMFRQMLEAGYIPTELPRIVGWAWSDRKRVPLVSKQFIADLSGSTNPAICLGGLCLSLIHTPFYPEVDFHAHEQDLLSAIGVYHDWVFSRADHAAIVGQTETILRDKYREPDVNVYFGREPFASFRQGIRKAYLTTQTNLDPTTVDVLFPHSYLTVSPDEARELAPLFDNFPTKNWTIQNASDQLHRLAGFPPRSAIPSVPKLVMPAGEPMVVKFISWNGNAFNAGYGSQPQVQRVIERGHRLWVQVEYLKPNYFTPFDSPAVYAAIDPLTGRSEAMAFPEELGSPDPGYEVTEDSLYVSMQDHLERYRFREKNWQSIPVPMAGGAQIAELNGRLYLSTAESVLEVMPDSDAVQILASSRRQPPANEMDSLLNNGPHELFQTAGQLGLAIGNQIFIFMPTNRIWRHLPELPFKTGGGQKYYSDQGAHLFVARFPLQLLFGIAFDATAPELLLEQYDDRGPTNQVVNRVLARPRWNWPEHFHLDSSCLIAEGKDLWILHARKIPMPFFGTEEPVVFQDDRQATLLHFEAGVRQPLAVPVRFDKDGQPTDPFDRKQLAFTPIMFMPKPFWIATQEGLVVLCPNLMGHWLIPRTELEKRLATLRTVAQEEDGAKLNSTPTGDLHR